MTQIKKRDHKESKGINSGARKNPQTPLALVLMNKGLGHVGKRSKSQQSRSRKPSRAG